MSSRKVLIVEDDQGLQSMLVDRLSSSGFETLLASDGRRALELAESEALDLILLDLMLPEIDGLEVCAQLRRRGHDTPILMLTALDTVVDRVVGLRIGADDYLAKPFESIELMARIEALIRRSESAPRRKEDRSVSFGDVQVHFSKMQLFRGGEQVHTTAKMFQLLEVLVDHEGDVLSRNRLLDLAWSEDAMPSARTVDVHIAWLRQRIEKNPSRPRHLLTVRGAGYRFVS